MREISTKILKYNELSNDAKEKARQDYASKFGYLNEDEAFASIKALAEHFGCKVKDYEVDFFGYFASNSSMSFDIPYDGLSRDEIKERLDKLGEYNPENLKGTGECVLTGVCHDEDAIDGFRKEFLHSEHENLEAMLKAAFKTWLTACQNDCHEFYGELSEYGDESFAEHSNANDYEYYKDGTFYSGTH